MRRIGEHAVVIGGSVAGLLAARSLAGAYERVTIVDRDGLPDGVERRKAVPQDRHAHVLLPRGQACLDALLPGFGADLVAAGAASCAALEEMRLVIGGHQLARASMGSRTILASRPFIEGHVRRRIRELPQITLVERCDALGLTASRDRSRVTGVRILRRADGSAEETLASDLVVAATGRAGRIPAWLEALSCPSPSEERLDVGVTYASRRLSIRAGALGGDRFVLVGARPGRPRTLFLSAQEGGRWILGLGGYGVAHRPPSDPDGFAAFAATVAPPDVLEAVEAAEVVDEIAMHRFPASVRRRYDRLRGFPAGLLVVGDALCSFNPTYGQGMTVAAAEAVALRDCLAHGGRDLARRFFHAARAPIGHAWAMSVGTDLSLPEVEGRRGARGRFVNEYLSRLQATAEEDVTVAGAFSAVVGMLERPRHVLRPAVAARVARGPRRARRSPRADGVRRRELRVGEVRTLLREAGPPDASEAVVFLHGRPGSSGDWEPLLAAAGRRWRAVAWDAPGSVHAAAAAGLPGTVGAHAAFVGRALDALGIEHVHLVARGVGGPVGLAWAASEPERLATAVLVDSAAPSTDRRRTLARLVELYRSVANLGADGQRLARALPRAETGLLERGGHEPLCADPAAVAAGLTGFLARHAGR